MTFFNRLELKYRRYAIPNLMLYLTALYTSGIVISVMMPQVYYDFLSLNVERILHGQIWRLVTWLMYPPSGTALSALIMLFVYYSVGKTLTAYWGDFKMNVFLFMGFFFHILAAFILYAIYKVPVLLTPANLNLSILLAFIASFPDARFYLFFLLPVKASWMGILYAVLTLLEFIRGGNAQRITIVLSLMNFVIFMCMTGKAKAIVNNVKNKIKNR